MISEDPISFIRQDLVRKMMRALSFFAISGTLGHHLDTCAQTLGINHSEYVAIAFLTSS